MVRIIAAKRHGQIVAHAEIYQIRLALGGIQPQLLAALHHLKNQLLILTALLVRQVGDILHARSLYGGKSERAVSILDYALHVIPDPHLLRHNILHPVHRFLFQSH